MIIQYNFTMTMVLTMRFKVISFKPPKHRLKNNWNLPHVWFAIVRLCAATSQVETPVYTCLFMYVCLCTQKFLPVRWRRKAELWQTKHVEDSNRSFHRLELALKFECCLSLRNIFSMHKLVKKVNNFLSV